MLTSMGKIIKHDSAALLRVLWPMMVAVAGCSVVGFLSNLFGSTADPSKLVIAVSGLLAMVQVFCIVAIVVLMVVAEFMVYFAYYRSLYTDEGYLTMVLPVGVHTLLLSKLLVGAIFSLAIGCIGIAGISFSLAPTIRELFWLFADIYQQIPPSAGATAFMDTLLDIVTFVSQAFFSFMMVYAAITMGAIYFRRHSLIGAITVFFVLSALCSIVEGVFTVVLVLASVEYFVAVILLLVVKVLLYMGLGVGLYWYIVRLHKTRLNLT